MNEIAAKVAGGLLHVGRIYLEAAIREYARGREMMDRFLAADLVKVPSHWNIPELHGDESGVEEWNRTKKTVLVLGVKKGLRIRPFTAARTLSHHPRRTDARWPARTA